eukprot:TRINITY_DN1095_c0_g1_i1.p1 TRINITY_DN1095_c0_g1~~TRINITY_DN1095_c0_g1_i1.p1  ORF type:complete len:280 (-),score=48.51 TRINITY_DN1095_c0_g1_i1:84-923(-)
MSRTFQVYGVLEAPFLSWAVHGNTTLRSSTQFRDVKCEIGKVKQQVQALQDEVEKHKDRFTSHGFQIKDPETLQEGQATITVYSGVTDKADAPILIWGPIAHTRSSEDVYLKVIEKDKENLETHQNVCIEKYLNDINKVELHPASSRKPMIQNKEIINVYRQIVLLPSDVKDTDFYLRIKTPKESPHLIVATSDVGTTIFFTSDDWPLDSHIPNLRKSEGFLQIVAVPLKFVGSTDTCERDWNQKVVSTEIFFRKTKTREVSDNLAVNLSKFFEALARG